jgi:hypothetical protein
VYASLGPARLGGFVDGLAYFSISFFMKNACIRVTDIVRGIGCTRVRSSTFYSLFLFQPARCSLLLYFLRIASLFLEGIRIASFLGLLACDATHECSHRLDHCCCSFFLEQI